MNDIITLLHNKKQAIITELKLGNTINQHLITQLDKAISWLSTIEKYQLDHAKLYDIHSLPDTSHGMSFFHLMIDCESSDPADWVEYTPENKAIEICIGDLVIVKK
jgi:hypothetical protein